MKYNEMVNAVNQVIRGYTMALTLRQIYYRLVAAALIPNTRSAYNSLSSQLVTAREQGEVNENHIVDRSRRIDDYCFDTPEDFLQACRNTLEQSFVRRFWITQPVYVEVWVEKDALSQVLMLAVREFNTIVCPSRGYSSYSYLRQASARISRYSHEGNLDARRYGKPVLILHFADHDPSGLDMSRDLEDRLSRYSDSDIQFRRIALTFDQVKNHSLIPNPTKLADPRSYSYTRQYGNTCWELDALDPNELVRIAHEVVENEIQDIGAWQELKEQEQGERQELEKRLKTIQS